MSKIAIKPAIRAALSIGGTVVLALTLTGCMSAEEQRRANLNEDSGTCSDFGARYGSSSHTDCMLQQQQRRDQEQLLAMERARISSETARNNMEMIERMKEKERRRNR